MLDRGRRHRRDHDRRLADLDDEERTFWQRAEAEGEQSLNQDFQEVAEWVESGMPDLDALSADDHHIVVQALTEAVSAGPAGSCTSLAIDRRTNGRC